VERKSVLKKPRVLQKMIRYRERMKKREYALQLVELNYNNACNYNCEHCFSHFLSKEQKLTPARIRDLSAQADQLGAWQFHLQGGEPLIWPDLDEVLAAIDPEKFYVFLTTNGWMLTQEKAHHLAGLGVDKISVSLDSFNAAEHDAFRKQPGAYQKAMDALFHAKAAGMQANINTVITHQNIHSDSVIQILEFAKQHQFTVLFVIATSSGKWVGRTDLLITPEDANHILKLKEAYPFIHRDIFPLFDFEWGCRTLNGLIYITPSGDVLSCPFIHISLGNILNEPLREILQRGWRVKYFRDHVPHCLAGEDRLFIEKFMGKTKDIVIPISFNEAFSKDDLYDEEPLGL